MRESAENEPKHDDDDVGSVGRVLLRAVLRGDASRVIELLNDGADVDHPNEDRFETPLKVACRQFARINVRAKRSSPDYLNIARIVLAFGARTDAVVDDDGRTLLHMAAAISDHENDNDGSSMAELLLQHGTDVDRIDKNGHTPLLIACLGRCTGCAEVLLRNGADVNRSSSALDGGTALLVAVSRGDLRTVERLLEYGAKTEVPDSTSASPLGVACLLRHKLGIVEALLQQKAGERDFKSLLNAVLDGDLAIVELFSRYRRVLLDDFRTSTGLTILGFACLCNQVDVVALLLRRGVDVDGGDVDGWSAIHTAASGGRWKIVDVLISHGADVNRGAYTPLQVAICRGHTEVVRVLVDGGADLDAGGRPIPTPLYLAVERRDYDTVGLLVDAGLNVSGEGWLRNGDELPPGLAADDPLPVWLRALATNPSTLLQLTRRRIRRLVGRRLTEVIPRLELPVTVKDFILLQDGHAPNFR